MKNIILNLILPISWATFGQHSESFLNLVKIIKPSDSTEVENFYKDGSLKNKGKVYFYETKAYTYSNKVGPYTEYYENGKIKSESVYDDYGNILCKTLYDRQGHISSKLNTIYIDTELKDDNEFFVSDKRAILTIEMKNYQLGKETAEIYLREKGILISGKRTGTWQIYTQRGQLDREVNYD